MAMQTFDDDDLTDVKPNGATFDAESAFCDQCLVMWNSYELTFCPEDGRYYYDFEDRLCKRCVEKFRRRYEEEK
jgi:hypothetical protein